MDLAHLISEFRSEAQEHLATAEEDVLAMEQAGRVEGKETLNRLFRALHTIKGGAACVHFEAVKEFAHEMENVAGLLREGVLAPSPEISHVLLEGVDKLKSAIFGSHGSVENPGPVLERLRGLVAKASGGVPYVKPPAASNAHFDLSQFDLREIREGGMHVFDIHLDAGEECLRLGCTPSELLVTLGSIGTVLACVPNMEDFGSQAPAFSICSVLLASIIDDPEILFPGLGIEPLSFLHYSPDQLPELALVAPAPVSAATPDAVLASTPRPPEKLLRIPVEVADKLMNLAGELVVVRNRSQQLFETGNPREMSALVQRLDVVTSDIQRMVMRTRMQPVGNVFGRFTRVVRDLGRSLGKELELEIIGGDVELDKSIIDGLVDPLTHLVRNSVDHGIESPEDRRRLGKPAVGRIRLVAEHQAGLVNILVIDDGRGMDPEKLRAAAVSKGLMTSQEAQALGDREALELVFLPGFSTAREITDVSGRGVGMDVVRASLQKLGGVVEITSKVGEGSSLSIRLPLTLAIIPAILLAAHGQCFAVPQVSVLEVVWLYGEQVYQSIQTIDDSEVYWLRGRMLPLIRLSTVLGLGPGSYDTEDGSRPQRRAELPDRRQGSGGVGSELRTGVVERRVSVQNSLYIIVLRVGSDRFGLVVERIVDTEEIVVKPLHERLKASRVYAGVTVLGDGTTALIFDVPELARAGGVLCEKSETPAKVALSRSEFQKMLVFTNGVERFALPLSLLMRVDAIQSGDLQTAAGNEFLRFGESVIPLVRIETLIPTLASDYGGDCLHAIIPRIGKRVGILAARIIDIFEIDNNSLIASTRQPGVIGTQVIDGHATTLLDLCALLEGGLASEPVAVRRILLAEDSSLYLALITSFLRGQAFAVVTAKNGREALELLASQAVDAVVSDIEMPELDGMDLARQLRSDPKTRHLPLVAISTVEEKLMRSRAVAAGFDEYCSKSNLPRLGEVLQELLLHGGRVA